MINMLQSALTLHAGNLFFSLILTRHVLNEGGKWARVGTAKHLWIDWMDSRFLNNMAECEKPK